MTFIPVDPRPFPWDPDIPPFDPTDPRLLEGAVRLLEVLAAEHDGDPMRLMALHVASMIRTGIPDEVVVAADAKLQQIREELAVRPAGGDAAPAGA